MSPPPPLTIEVIAYAPVAFFHCLHCEFIWQETAVRSKDRREQLDTSLPEDLRLQYQQLSDWVHRMVQAHGANVRFRIIDAASVEGWLKSVRYRLRRYPAVIVDGEDRFVGPQFESAGALIERRLAAVRG
jgi:hypothetical protein